MNPPVSLLALVCSLLVASPALPAPDWLEDPANSRWIAFGGPSGIADSRGIALRDAGREGTLTPIERGGQTAAQSLIDGTRMGYFYLVCEPWEELKSWLDGGTMALTVRYFDGAPGTMTIQYDSSDERVRHPPYPAGVWKVPPSADRGVPLKGTKTWQSVNIPLPMAFFQRRLHGADIRLNSAGADFALAGVAITRLPAGADPTQQVRQQLRVATCEGMETFGAGARFAGTFSQQPDSLVVMEAELATTLSLTDGQSVGMDERASGGGYLHFVASATWRFELSRSGRYRVWERGYFPWPGSWNHCESVDGQHEQMIDDSTGTPPDAWKWVRAGLFDLTPGDHTFALSYHAGARLDLLVLAPEGWTPPESPASLDSSYRGAREGVIVMEPVRPLHVVQWRQVEARLANAGDAVLEVATAATPHTWLPVPADGSLSALPVTGDGTDQLQFRWRCQGQTGAPPFMAGATVTYLGGERNVRIVENAAWRVGFDACGIAWIEDRRRQQPVSRAPQMHAALASLAIKPPGPAAVQTIDLYHATLEQLTVDGEGTPSPRVTMVHQLRNGLRLKTLAAFTDDGQSTWQLAIENRSPLEVAELRFPVVTGVGLGGVSSDDWIAVSKCWGQIWQNPARQRVTTAWGPSMRWLGMWDDAQGLYLGIEDERLDDYAFAYGGDPAGATVSPAQRILVRPASTWTSATYRLALTAGGSWHPAADIYRARVSTALQAPAVPPHVLWLVDGWSTQRSNDAPVAGWDMIRPTENLLMAANRQMLDGADSGYCGLYLYPSPTWGTIREFSQKLGVLHAHGQLYTPYHNFHLWSPGYGHYPRIGTFPKRRLPPDAPTPDDAWYARAVAAGYDGSYPRLEADRFAQIGMAMPSREWRDWLKHWTAAYLDWGADGMYYDQFNMIYPSGRLYPDYPDSYGSWARATLDTIRQLRDTSRRRNPFYTSSGEVCNDVYGQILDLHMTSGVFNRLDLYRYCNPDQLLIDGGWNGGTGAAWGGPRRWRFIWQTGARFEGDPGPAILALRRAVKSHLYAATYRDTVGLTIRDKAGKPLGPEFLESSYRLGPVSGCTGRWFLIDRQDQRGALVNFLCDPVAPGAMATIDTAAFGPVRAAWAWTLDGQRLPVRGSQTGDRYTFPIPAAELSTVVLVNRLAPMVTWDFPSAVSSGTSVRMAISLANLMPDAIGGTASLRLPKGWDGPRQVGFGPLAPGESLRFELPIEIPRRASTGLHDWWADLRTDSGDFSAYALAGVSERVIADFRGNPGTCHIYLRNLTDDPLDGTVSVRAPAPLAATAGPFLLPPRAEIRVPVAVTGHERLAEIAEMTATVRLDRQQLELVRAVIPAVPNGSFETDSAGDLKPDWWMCRKDRDEWAYERLHLAEDAHGGRYALLLDAPAEGEKFTCAYPVHSVLAPNTRYRIGVWIRSAATEGVYLQAFNLQLGKGKTGPDWQHFQGEVVTPPSGGSLYRTLYNFSSYPAYFDDLVVEKLD